MRSHELYTLTECQITRETDAAVLVSKNGEQYWIPFSQIEKMTRDSKSQCNDSVTMTAWIAKQKGLL